MKKKTLAMFVCALVIMSSVAFGTIAYLTDSATVTNHFTIGKVDIVVDETLVDNNGDPVPNPDYDPTDPTDDPFNRTELRNEYPLIPGKEYVKDPTMTVKAGSETAYVRMVVTISNAAELKDIFAQLALLYPDDYPNGFLPEQHVTGWDNNVWQYAGMAENAALNTITLEFRYPTPVTATVDVVLPSLFDTIKVPGVLTSDHLAKLQNLSITVDGHAIQQTGFTDAATAWAAFDAQTAAIPQLPAQP